MSEEITEYVEHYMLHDPIGNVEGVIAEYDTAKLVEAEERGAVFIAVYNTGRRAIVKARDITPPEPVLNGVTVVQPEYVDERMRAVIGVFDALGSPQPAVNAATGGEARSTFEEALAALKALVYGEEE